MGSYRKHSSACKYFVEREAELAKAKEVYEKIIDEAIRLNGTVSAEHGIGKLKKEYLSKMFGNQTIDYMKSIKLLFDKENLLGKGNIFS